MKRKYVPDLTRQMAVCQANYARLQKLLPKAGEHPVREFRVVWHQKHVLVRLHIDEEFRYTSSVVMTHIHEPYSPWLESPQLVIRLYHDALMAEVICARRRKQLSGVYGYPNRNMHQPDEKIQLNLFLGEWLNQCLNHGHQLEVALPE
ncbi:MULTISPECIES: DUF1249 domain-containing protein [Nitrincola]|jgi:uncharacterized protein YqiB (DUF1249 family)|uniref:Putative dehydrogenase n=1 Tax=Nitrincola nitratireducens TaxID=1229521 RepID=W9VFI8_9GAMM|nr:MULTISPECIES: DUF1249 domain-containing protein [Nitrincola]EXJ09440.1 putative dehydrogenase [Nitrincola nitratireducens]